MDSEMSSDDLWVGVKSQPSLEIAGSPRKACRRCLSFESSGGRALMGVGGLPPKPVKLRIPLLDGWETDYGG